MEADSIRRRGLCISGKKRNAMQDGTSCGVGTSVVCLIPASSKSHPLRTGISFVLLLGVFLSPAQSLQAVAAQHSNSAAPRDFARKQAEFGHLYFHDPDDPNSIATDTIHKIFEDRFGVLWLGTSAGLCPFDRQEQRFIRYQRDPKDPGSLSNDQVFDLLDRFQSGESAGFSSLTFEHFAHDPDDPLSLSQNQIQGIVEDRAGTLWIGTFAGGLNRFNRAEETFGRYLHNPQDYSSLSHNTIRTLRIDRSGLLWIGTGGGINTVDSARKPFRHFSHDPFDPNSLSSSDVRSICEDGTGTLWIGTQGGGLNKLVSTFAAHATSNHASGERLSITQTLKKTNWRIKGQGGAAKRLGVNPETLYSKMKKLGIPTHRERTA